MHERTMSGLIAARARGRVDGRPRALSAAQLAHAQTMAAAGTPVCETAKLVGSGKSTVYRSLRQKVDTND